MRGTEGAGTFDGDVDDVGDVGDVDDVDDDDGVADQNKRRDGKIEQDNLVSWHMSYVVYILVGEEERH